MDKKLKVLFIPADGIEVDFSRSYFFAKGLSKHSDLYYVTWKDFRSVQWLGGELSKLNTLRCFQEAIHIMHYNSLMSNQLLITPFEYLYEIEFRENY